MNYQAPEVAVIGSVTDLTLVSGSILDDGDDVPGPN